MLFGLNALVGFDVCGWIGLGFGGCFCLDALCLGFVLGIIIVDTVVVCLGFRLLLGFGDG